MVYEFFLSFTIFFFFWSLEGYAFSLFAFIFPWESQLCIKRNHLSYFDRIGVCVCVLVCVYTCVYDSVYFYAKIT